MLEFELVAGARQARGVAVVIDVFRASSVACHAAAAGAARIHPVGDEVIDGTLVSAAAVSRYLLACAPRIVSLVRMGHEAREPRAGRDGPLPWVASTAA
ncbi:MAG: 2-phosphosulfolactate phosphatase [Steroidobacteraceae bacterium]|jgi:phosphosulfolactate phosphohydrolase-like enzyme|nr:2-phosphosulfolactate phosphatase [Steroidobacteraceae bacterium]